MKFNEFDLIMRQYEESIDQYIVDGMYIVVRLDGRGFTKFTKRMNFDKPFDTKFNYLMVETTKYLIKNSGFRIIYGYTQSDEISLLFSLKDNTFNRKVRKINTILASEASAYFTKLLIYEFGIENSDLAVFDCRVIPLPNKQKVIDYFKWRQEDSYRNSLNAWCYWTLRKDGFSKRQATAEIKLKNNTFKHELLFSKGINYNNLPGWQKKGTGLTFINIIKNGFNPITNEKVFSVRRDVIIDEDIPIKDMYDKYLLDIINSNES